MTGWPGCAAYQGTRSTRTGVWLPCESCACPWEAHSPNARLLHEDRLQVDRCPTCGAPRGTLSDPDANRAGIAGSRPTSAAAALRVQPRTGTQRRRILDYITAHGPSTDEQIQRALDLSGNTERPRRVELVEGGWLEEGDRFPPRSTAPGSFQCVRWRLTAQARARLQGAA